MRIPYLTSVLLSALALTFLARQAQAQTAINAKALQYHSVGSNPTSTNDWTLNSDGYVGTYIHVNTPGPVTFTVNAAGTSAAGISPDMTLSIADYSHSFSVTSASKSNFTFTTPSLPAGDYFVRTQLDNHLAASPTLTLGSLTVGANASIPAASDTEALAAANTYINNFRKGNATVQFQGLAPGTPVNVSLKRIDFNFGTSTPGTDSSSVNAYLGSNGTAQQTVYQAALNKDFNAITPENIGKWSNNEAGNTQPASPTLSGFDAYLNYAQAHNMTARAHNLIWGEHAPTWVANAITANNKPAVDAAITNRINYYVGTGTAADRDTKYQELDVYNESYHTGQADANPTFWSVEGAAGVANIYNQVAAAVAKNPNANVKLFTNEYNVFQNNTTNYGTFYANNIAAIRQAGGAVGGVGIQYYPNSANGIGSGDSQHSPSRIESTLQNLAVQGLPMSLNEFGVDPGGSSATVNSILTDSMTLMFGMPQSTGFYMWGFESENGGGNLFKSGAALYTVDTSNWNTLTLTDAGKAWEDLLGIHDWDNNPNDAWTTQLTGATAPTVNPDGTINFNGFYGLYDLTVNGKTYEINFTKDGASTFLIAVPEPAPLALIPLFALALFSRKSPQRRGRFSSLNIAQRTS